MHKTLIIPLAAGLALCTTAAFAADQSSAPPAGRHWGHHWHMDKKDMAKHFKAMCANRYARAVGGMAYLQTRLNLTDQQKPAFDRWKGEVLNSAKAASDQCAAMKPPAKRPSLVDQAKFRERVLEMRLHSLKAQMPALERLTAALDKKQDRILERAVHRMMMHHHGRRGFGHGPMHGQGPMWHHGPGGPGGPR